MLTPPVAYSGTGNPDWLLSACENVARGRLASTIRLMS
ncbi:hypothetical protein FTUN_7377 [Frigoriglobus tundricola]|uniref:Uncharacterized protein n=1 Tax=Frigoriglobus tundricola TaxID=2774151 RepID=A0A6M5Z1R5_9BACT|nr:hypothetical protein FTUN_7377 [Frigoriglobus tundricola]